MRVYVLSEHTFSFQNSFEVLGVYRDKAEAEKERARLDEVTRAMFDNCDPNDPPQSSDDYVVEEFEVT